MNNIEMIETHYDNGQLCARYTRKDGKRDGLYEYWHENGTLWVRCTHKDGKLDGLYEYWHENGTLWVRCTYKDGNLDGLYESWYPNEQLCARCTYKDGKLDGLYESWHENGKPWKRRTYTDGVLVEDLLKQEETKMETSEATGKNKSVRIALKGVEIEVEESVLIEALEAKGIKTFKPEPEPKRKPKWAVNSTGGIVHLCIYNKDHIAAYIRQGRAFYSWDDAEAFVAMERQMAAVVGTEPEIDDCGWSAISGSAEVFITSAWQAEHALGLTAKTRKELEPKVAVFKRFQQIEKVGERET